MTQKLLTVVGEKDTSGSTRLSEKKIRKKEKHLEVNSIDKYFELDFNHHLFIFVDQ